VGEGALVNQMTLFFQPLHDCLVSSLRDKIVVTFSKVDQ
jgi:hypothetical protein